MTSRVSALAERVQGRTSLYGTVQQPHRQVGGQATRTTDAVSLVVSDCS
jgi:hypothetical protein